MSAKRTSPSKQNGPSEGHLEATNYDIQAPSKKHIQETHLRNTSKKHIQETHLRNASKKHIQETHPRNTSKKHI
jgi:hypothetical protein